MSTDISTLSLHDALPISFAIPIIMAGIRLSTVYLIGWATLASFIGAGGLGSYIFDGLNLYLPEFIIAGAIPSMLMAVVVRSEERRVGKEWRGVDRRV